MKTIELSRGLKAIVDDDDFEALSKFKWCAYVGKWQPYAVRRKDGRVVRMHREIMNPPKGMYVDHINGNGLDNRRKNLRVCTNQENSFNAKSFKKTKGFYFRKDCLAKPYQVHIMVDYKKIHIGYFATEQEAGIAYNQAAKKYFGDFARLNDPV